MMCGCSSMMRSRMSCKRFFAEGFMVSSTFCGNCRSLSPTFQHITFKPEGHPSTLTACEIARPSPPGERVAGPAAAGAAVTPANSGGPSMKVAAVTTNT